VTNPKGTQAESALVKYLQSVYPTIMCERKVKHGKNDVGDVWFDNVIFEVKNYKAANARGKRPESQIKEWRTQTGIEFSNAIRSTEWASWRSYSATGMAYSLAALVIKPPGVGLANVQDWECQFVASSLFILTGYYARTTPKVWLSTTLEEYLELWREHCGR